MLVPDNLKAAVVKTDRYEPSLNRVMEDMANHYGTVIIPARPAHPKDKSNVEGTVRLVYMRVFAELRNETFHSLEELNRAASLKMKAHNQKRMQKHPYTREERFLAVDRPNLMPLPDRDFEIVQRLLGMDTRISPDSDMVYNLSGIAVCADCGSPMTRKITTAGDKKYAYYICSNHKLTKQCSQHSISVSLLEDTVLEMLKLHIKNVMNLEEILDYIGTIPFQQLDVKSLEARKQKKLEEVEKCKRLKTSLYEDMKDGILTKEEYLELHEAYLKKAKEGEEIIRQIERDIALIFEEKDDKHLWMNYFTEYKDIKELTRDVVVKLISEVRVSENKEIEIVFDFDDCYKKLLESVEKLGYQVDKEPGGQLNISRREAV